MSAIDLTHGDQLELPSGEVVRVGIDGDCRVVDRRAELPGSTVLHRFEISGKAFSAVWVPKAAEGEA